MDEIGVAGFHHPVHHVHLPVTRPLVAAEDLPAHVNLPSAVIAFRQRDPLFQRSRRRDHFKGGADAVA